MCLFCVLCVCLLTFLTHVLFYFIYFYFHIIILTQDLSSPNQYDTGVALTGLSCFVTPDLARDLANDIMTLVSHRGSVFFP